MIPEAAVEAAAKAAYIAHSNEPGFNAEAAWDDMAGTDDWEYEKWESTARAALEVAVPHMLAGILEDAANTAEADELTTAAEVVYDLRRHAKDLRPTK